MVMRNKIKPLHVARAYPADKLLWLLFYCWILIDSFNGFLRDVGADFPFSQIVKFGAFFIVLVRLINKDIIKVLFFITLVYILIISLNVYSLGNDVFAAIILISKPITSFFFFYFFVNFKRYNEQLFWNLFKKIVVLNFVFLSANIILGLMGYGNVTYEVGEEEGVGIKGYIISQNELSLVVAVIYPLLLWLCSLKYKRSVFYLLGVLIIFISFSISTKASIIISLASVAFVGFYTGCKRERRIIVIIVLCLLVLFFAYISVVLDSEIGFIKRFTFFLDNKGVLDAVLSGRLDQLETESRIFFYKNDVVTQVIGKGEAPCELDPFQALFSFGYIGGLLNTLFIIYVVLKPRTKKYKSIYEKIIVFSNTIIVLLSLTSGHVFFSSMGGLFVALANASVYKK
jgi:hypothetical protein